MKVTVGEVATCSGSGPSHGLVLGRGPTPDDAIAAMRATAEERAQPVVEKRVGALLPYQRRVREPGHWNLDFGIYDVRLVVEPAGDWVAYGTLVETGTVDIKAPPPRRTFRPATRTFTPDTRR